MPRPTCPRRVARPPACDYFKPRGVPMTALEEVTLSVDELEALRLADLEGLYQEAAAERLGVSRTTFGRIVGSARHKVAEALVLGKALSISGGAVAWSQDRQFVCDAGGHRWSLPLGSGRPEACAGCGSQAFHRVDGGPRGAERPAP
jgi:predicted DNA-binding protein (UPF0251 family)